MRVESLALKLKCESGESAGKAAGAGKSAGKANRVKNAQTW